MPAVGSLSVMCYVAETASPRARSGQGSGRGGDDILSDGEETVGGRGHGRPLWVCSRRRAFRDEYDEPGARATLSCQYHYVRGGDPVRRQPGGTAPDAAASLKKP